MNRKNRKSRPRGRGVNRAAQQKDGDKIQVFRQTDGTGYDVEMIRDFLENLLLEVRVQHYENLQALQLTEKHGDLRTVCEELDRNISPALVEQLGKYVDKYRTQLVRQDVINGENATQSEIATVAEAFIRVAVQKRDEQVGHLEALQELFDEALMCAKAPFGALADGRICRTIREIHVRECIDGLERDDASLST